MHKPMTFSSNTAVERLRKGIRLSEFNKLTARLGLTKEDFAKKIGVSAATLSRRKKAKAPLDLEHGDRLLRFEHLFEKAVTLFDGDEDRAKRWLNSPARAFDFAIPLTIAETEAGARAVETLIRRLEYGVLT